MSDYEIDLSVSEKYSSNQKVIEVDKESNAHLYKEVYKIADDDNTLDGIISKEALDELLNNIELQDLFLFKHIVKDFDEILNVIDKNRESIKEYIHRVNSGHKNFENKKVELDLEEKIKNKYAQLRFYFDFEFADKLQKYRYAPEYKVENIYGVPLVQGSLF